MGAHSAGNMPGAVPAAARRSFGVGQVNVRGAPHIVSTHELAEFPFAVLTQFRRLEHEADCPGEALVVVPLAGAFPMLMRDLVVGLLGLFPRVSITEWFDARHVPLSHGRFSLSENIAHTADMLGLLGKGVHLFGVCQGAVAALGAAALQGIRHRQEVPSSVILLGGPIAPLANPTRIVRIMRAKPLGWFADKLERVPEGNAGAGRLVYPASSQRVLATAYAWRHVLSGDEIFRKFVQDDGDDPLHYSFAKLFFSLMDLPGELFLDTVAHVYQASDALSGGVSVEGHPVDPACIVQGGLMVVEGADDDIAAPGQTAAALQLCRNLPENRKAYLALDGCSHFSLFHGQTMRHKVLPEVSRFVQAVC
ncbi:hypothetical protein H2509_19990 [Stappia sp. F7233]|uniref:PHB de-polymerase C-terminal domain-containing protein n=1 Tax=Stappia albiluteola TaxID=2758565 RepID=A0A839AK62_9HYPH|nr:hypothetical protein [Stappia albiluteola]MBA5779418.1 hypothetical protein [Stappia albiluteola]